MALVTFVKRNRVFLGLNVLIVPLLAALTYFTILSPALLAVSVVLINILPKVEDLKRRWETSEHRDEVRSRTAAFNEELESFENLFQNSFLETERYGSENLINYAESIVENDDEVHLPLLYIYLHELSDFELENHERTTLEKNIQTTLNSFSLVHPSEEDTSIAWGAYQILCDETPPFDLTPPDRGFMENECFNQKFIHEFLHKQQVISKLTSEHEELEDYRHTLSKLYDSGKLSKFGIQQALLELDEELSYVLTDKTHYFILINEMQKETEIIDDITKLVNAVGDEVYTGSLNLSGGMYSMVLCVCDESWETREFYERFVEEPFEEHQADGVLSVHRAKFEGSSIFKQRYEETEPSGNILRGIKSRNLLTTGEEAATINLKEKLIESYLSTDELLSVLPLNLFLPDLPSEKKEMLIENNEDIKAEFGIEELTDWAHPNYPAEEIGEFLQTNYFPDDSKEVWVKNAESIIAEAKSVEEALS